VGGGGITVARKGFLNGPLGLAIAPNGDILTADANDGNIVETTPVGAEFQPLETGEEEGSLFGLTPQPGGHGLYFVNDAQNELDLAH
jgi:NHL repeat